MPGHAAQVITVGPPGVDDAAGRVVTLAIQTEGMAVAARQVVDDDETRLEPLLAGAIGASVWSSSSTRPVGRAARSSGACSRASPVCASS